ncbi:MAG: nickel/cobalt transporter [Campylobacterales bacterium]
MNTLTEQNQTSGIYQDTLTALAQLLHSLSIKLGALLTQIKDGDSLAPIAIFLLISFAYGFVHASGPGHGKALVASYFSSTDKGYKKAITIALMIATVHTFSALLITLVGYFALSAVFSVAIVNTTNILTKISGVAIVALGVYFLYNKIKHYKNLRKQTPKWSVTQPHSCSCAACKTKDSSELALILSAGIVPCPGTITVFLFAITLELYFVGFLSAVAMSLGMGTVIALTAALSVKIRKSLNSRFSKFIAVLDFGAVAVIITLGVLLLIL